MKIHHVGIAVRSVDEAAARFGVLLGLAKGERYVLPEFGVCALFVPVGDSNLELLEPLSHASTVSKFIEKKGEGLHHICFEVDDIDASLDDFRSQGARLIDENRIDLIDDRVIMITLNQRFHVEFHIVPKIIETEFVVGSVGDIAIVSFLTLDIIHVILDTSDG